MGLTRPVKITVDFLDTSRVERRDMPGTTSLRGKQGTRGVEQIQSRHHKLPEPTALAWSKLNAHPCDAYACRNTARQRQTPLTVGARVGCGTMRYRRTPTQSASAGDRYHTCNRQNVRTGVTRNREVSSCCRNLASIALGARSLSPTGFMAVSGSQPFANNSDRNIVSPEVTPNVPEGSYST